MTAILSKAAEEGENSADCKKCGKAYDFWLLKGVPDWLNYCSKECYEAGTGEKPCQSCGEYGWRCQCERRELDDEQCQ